MPIYEFQCTKCKNQFEEIILKNDDSRPKCPSCGSTDVEKLLSPGNIRAKGIVKGKGGFSAPSCPPSG
ncbi:MAG: FmdB family zinc ribbon protein [Desulfovibrionales bacterium]